MIISTAVQDLKDAVDLMGQVLVPDHLDGLDEADWGLLIELRKIQRDLLAICLHVAARNRAIIEKAWIGGSAQVAPPGGGPDTASGG